MPDSWSELCRVSFREKGGDSAVNFDTTLTEISNFEFATKEIDVLASLSGAGIVTRKSFGKESMSFKIYPVGEALDGNGAMQLMHPQDNDPIQSLAADDTTDPITVLNSHGRNTYMVTILWSTELPASAETVPDAGEHAYRIVIKNAYIESYQRSYDDKALSAEITLAWSPYDKTGASNVIVNTTQSGVVLPAVPSYT